MNKKINTDGLDNFFSFVSKAVIIIPIFIFIFSLFLKYNQSKNNSVINSFPSPSPIIQLAKNNSFKFNLQGPIVCDNLFIQNKKILFKNKQTNYLLNGDCLYIWEKGKTTGEKKCSLSNYISMAENYIGLFNINDLVSNEFIKDKIKNKDIDLSSVIKSCRREEIRDKKIFEVPNKINFKD